ncbi:hypothetical protein EDEG_00497 [Edhazardia aedis USNM 41457]|uniref:Uncharacterized protein n=1 Tax=Edhazardia aedis (strain USNM 41457) TaxID=1003232 RepID=J9DIV7_EDHAE|nr:hypothetical protein EDEG_00497 [Edhazardia aedis USNM 41457]|eukprot:EJW01312.1 hypothetical protein EDEG_00497 [Edhazardia aedis USNM 41457]
MMLNWLTEYLKKKYNSKISPLNVKEELNKLLNHGYFSSDCLKHDEFDEMEVDEFIEYVILLNRNFILNDNSIFNELNDDCLSQSCFSNDSNIFDDDFVFDSNEKSTDNRLLPDFSVEVAKNNKYKIAQINSKAVNEDKQKKTNKCVEEIKTSMLEKYSVENMNEVSETNDRILNIKPFHLVDSTKHMILKSNKNSYIPKKHLKLKSSLIDLQMKENQNKNVIKNSSNDSSVKNSSLGQTISRESNTSNNLNNNSSFFFRPKK